MQQTVVTAGAEVPADSDQKNRRERDLATAKQRRKSSGKEDEEATRHVV
jgi:hypothetical protein